MSENLLGTLHKMNFWEWEETAVASGTFCIQKIQVLFHNSWKWTFQQQQMLCLEWLRFSPRSMAAFSLHEVIINFKFMVYCRKGIKKRENLCYPLGWARAALSSGWAELSWQDLSLPSHSVRSEKAVPGQPKRFFTTLCVYCILSPTLEVPALTGEGTQRKQPL